VQPGQPPPQLQSIQNALQMPTWEEIMGVLRSDMQREYRVDVETDSTVAQSLQQDMAGLKEVLTSVVELVQGLGPAVQAGAMSVDTVKALVMSVVRRARMGLEVEDAIESGLQEPKPQADPKAQAEQAKAQQAQQQAQHDQQLAQQQQAHEQQMAQRQQAHEEQIAQREAALEAQRAANEQAAQQRQAEMDAAFERFKALLESQTKIQVAHVDAQTKLQVAGINAEASVEAAKNKPEPQTV
jgi:hypothetical protein